MNRMPVGLVVGLALFGAGACRGRRRGVPPRASGYVEATEVQVAPRWRAGRRLRSPRATASTPATSSRLSTPRDTELAIGRARANVRRPTAQLHAAAGGRARRGRAAGEAQVAAAAADAQAVEADDRGPQQTNAASNAAPRRCRLAEAARRCPPAWSGARPRDRPPSERVRAAHDARAREGRRPPGGNRRPPAARVAMVDAQIATLEKDRARTPSSPRRPAASSRAKLVEPAKWWRRARRSWSSSISTTRGPTPSSRAARARAHARSGRDGVTDAGTGCQARSRSSRRAPSSRRATCRPPTSARSSCIA